MGSSAAGRNAAPDLYLLRKGQQTAAGRRERFPEFRKVGSPQSGGFDSAAKVFDDEFTRAHAVAEVSGRNLFTNRPSDSNCSIRSALR